MQGLGGGADVVRDQPGRADEPGHVSGGRGGDHLVEELPDPEGQEAPVGGVGVPERGVELLPGLDGDEGGVRHAQLSQGLAVGRAGLVDVGVVGGVLRPLAVRRVATAEDLGREVLPDQVGDVGEGDEAWVLVQLAGGRVDVIGSERRELEADPVQVVAHQRPEPRGLEVLARQAGDRVVPGLPPERLGLGVVVDHETDVEQSQHVGQAGGEREVEAAGRRADEVLTAPLQRDRQELDGAVVRGLAEVPDRARVAGLRAALARAGCDQEVRDVVVPADGAVAEQERGDPAAEVARRRPEGDELGVHELRAQVVLAEVGEGTCRRQPVGL